MRILKTKNQICTKCKKVFDADSSGRFFCSTKCHGLARRRENSPSWNKNPTYSGIHQWLIYAHGKANHCDICHQLNKKKYNWSLKKGFKYERKIDNFFQLCVSCHRKYDYNPKIGEKISIKIRKSIIQYNLDMDKIKKYLSIKDASEKTKTHKGNICLVAKGKRRTANNYIWRYY